jgi:FGGY-family pentulose kinase
MSRCYLGIDVGTASVRAGLFDVHGTLLGQGSHPIQLVHPEDDYAEQSSADIWRASGLATRAALAQAGLDAAAVGGLGFDATCSLVVLDADDAPVTISPTGDPSANVIVWMDHRAIHEAATINQTHHAVLDYVGGVISPEMQTPKLLWLKRHLPETWARAARFLDLADFLAYRATGVDVRSLCTTTCKWTYVEQRGGWDPTYFRAVGLGDLADEGFRRIGTTVRPLGERLGGLSEPAAMELGLRPGTPVAVSIIDAHAGGLGMLGAVIDAEEPSPESLETRLALIGGTSTCHMAVSRDPKFIQGIWGPYQSAMVPGLWLTEGGQSATGALIDHTIRTHARGAELAAEAAAKSTTVYALLNARLDAMAVRAGVESVAELAADLHVLPYHHGNRSPRADPSLRGMVSGLRLVDTLDSLALLYLATIQAIAHGARHILDEMNRGGYRISTILACGGDTRNPLFVQMHADVTGCRVVLPREAEAVLVGAAVLGAVASGDYRSILEAMAAMTQAGKVVQPVQGRPARFHEAKHAVFLRMCADQLAYRAQMGA